MAAVKVAEAVDAVGTVVDAEEVAVVDTVVEAGEVAVVDTVVEAVVKAAMQDAGLEVNLEVVLVKQDSLEATARAEIKALEVVTWVDHDVGPNKSVNTLEQNLTLSYN